VVRRRKDVLVVDAQERHAATLCGSWKRRFEIGENQVRAFLFETLLQVAEETRQAREVVEDVVRGEDVVEAVFGVNEPQAGNASDLNVVGVVITGREKVVCGVRCEENDAVLTPQ
jgi:hypothetical protein